MWIYPKKDILVRLGHTPLILVSEAFKKIIHDKSWFIKVGSDLLRWLHCSLDCLCAWCSLDHLLIFICVGGSCIKMLTNINCYNAHMFTKKLWSFFLSSQKKMSGFCLFSAALLCVKNARVFFNSLPGTEIDLSVCLCLCLCQLCVFVVFLSGSLTSQ